MYRLLRPLKRESFVVYESLCDCRIVSPITVRSPSYPLSESIACLDILWPFRTSIRVPETSNIQIVTSFKTRVFSCVRISMSLSHRDRLPSGQLHILYLSLLHA